MEDKTESSDASSCVGGEVESRGGTAAAEGRQGGGMEGGDRLTEASVGGAMVGGAISGGGMVAGGRERCAGGSWQEDWERVDSTFSRAFQ